MKSKVYTKTGDKGSTSLVSGSRVSKGDERISLYGDVDELNSHLGLAYKYYSIDTDDKKNLTLLHKVQSALFDLGSNLACEYEKREKYKLPLINLEIISEMEASIDEMDEKLEPLKSFILPGGSLSASQLHVCRTVTRRVERSLVHFSSNLSHEAPENANIFLNRLSDYLFVLARFANFVTNEEELKWIAKKQL